MEKSSIISIATLALLAVSSQAYLQILHPKELKSKLGNDGVIRSSLGNFGHVVYGSTLVRTSLLQK